MTFLPIEELKQIKKGDIIVYTDDFGKCVEKVTCIAHSSNEDFWYSWYVITESHTVLSFQEIVKIIKNT